jgi:hypothetical protein
MIVSNEAQRHRLGAVYRTAMDEVAEIYAAHGAVGKAPAGATVRSRPQVGYLPQPLGSSRASAQGPFQN